MRAELAGAVVANASTVLGQALRVVSTREMLPHMPVAVTWTSHFIVSNHHAGSVPVLVPAHGCPVRRVEHLKAASHHAPYLLEFHFRLLLAGRHTRSSTNRKGRFGPKPYSTVLKRCHGITVVCPRAGTGAVSAAVPAANCHSRRHIGHLQYHQMPTWAAA